uniref:DUF1016 family protein n=1 Tax=Strongyloides stercoralis TaxID=6248 RepID=A0A0K0E079_STRER
MLKRLFKRNSSKMETTINAFAAAYGVLKSKWLKEQADAQGLTKEEQNQVSQRQHKELRQLITQFGLDEEQTIRRFPVPTLTDNDLNLELRSYEKELDEAFRKEIGRVVPYLTSPSITGLEHYIRRIDVAMLSIAKNEARKDILNILAAPYLPTLISTDNYLIRSYYDRCMMELSSEERPSLTNILHQIVNVMTLDDHRAR